MLLIINSCKQGVLAPVENDGKAPGPITNAVITNLNGAATISFNVPSDPDLLYIRAVYTTKQGVVRETKVSRYNSQLTVEGFADTSAYQVTLYAVDKGENASAPLMVTVHPKRPPFQLVRDSLAITPDFGGLTVNFKNQTGNSLAVVILSNDSLGEFVPINTFYTKLKKGDFATRGLQSVETKFGIYVRDRFGNLSDTLLFNLTPLFEERLDRTRMKGLVLPTDAPLGYSGNIAGLFDGNLGNDLMYHTGDAARMPQWFTYDMGVSAKLSRMSYFMRMGFYFNLHTPRVVEIWGTENPNPDGSYTGWTLLATHTQVKPSGLPNGQLSQDDIDAANAGETITFSIDAPKVRYIRFKTLKNWSNGSYVNFNEIMMWGDTK
ncbi:DUF4959 domain-containing protein [Mucilaginibacter gynuensis]|uniref:DUF4959 domain-containing protein n=2 Tax=Mucilaginibacter gynuensis TaxID=1302236 RepID=A0ABP8G1M7_9SPHI